MAKIEGSSRKVAVLIDAENVSHKLIDEVLNEVFVHGRATTKRIYGDFSQAQMKGWNEVANKHTLQQVTQIAYTKGKNASDSLLIIDAMDLLYEGTVDMICIVSSDSDFTRLAMRIVASGLEVLGMGEESKTAESFINACTTFKYIGAPAKKKAKVSSTSHAKKQENAVGTSDVIDVVPKIIQVPKDVVKAIVNAIESMEADNDGWVAISQIGTFLHNRFPDFDPRRWGAQSTQLSAFLKRIDDFEVEGRKSNDPKAPNYYIRIRT
jgi:Fe-S-cluster formation regulator IscX/YfhJ